MSEKRKKTHSILLRTQGKTSDILHSLELYDSRQWPDEACGPNLWRVRVNGVWHCPSGKFSFLTWEAVQQLEAQLFMGKAPVPRPVPYLPHKARVRVYLPDCQQPQGGTVHAPPHKEEDGRYHVWVWVFGHGVINFPCEEVTLVRVL